MNAGRVPCDTTRVQRHVICMTGLVVEIVPGGRARALRGRGGGRGGGSHFPFLVHANKTKIDSFRVSPRQRAWGRHLRGPRLFVDIRSSNIISDHHPVTDCSAEY